MRRLLVILPILVMACSEAHVASPQAEISVVTDEDVSAAPPPCAFEEPVASFDFPEDETGERIVADVQARIDRGDEASRLRFTVSALGPTVVPEPGYRGVHGANRITAVELDEILARDGARVVTRGVTGRKGSGTMTDVRRGRVPVRRLLPDGSLDHDAEAHDVLPLSVSFAATATGRGLQVTELLIDDKPRLRILWTHRRIVSIEAPPAHTPLSKGDRQ